jgi:hypothetical protein
MSRQRRSRAASTSESEQGIGLTRRLSSGFGRWASEREGQSNQVTDTGLRRFESVRSNGPAGMQPRGKKIADSESGLLFNRGISLFGVPMATSTFPCCLGTALWMASLKDSFLFVGTKLVARGRGALTVLYSTITNV